MKSHLLPPTATWHHISCVYMRCVFTISVVSVEVLDVEKQQKQAETDEWRYCAAQQESVAAMIVYYLRNEINIHTRCQF